MDTVEFFEQLDARIAKYDLLCHPFYKAWSAGELTRKDLRQYA
jgi:pyrroloquinoline-quinone synthase